MTGFKTLKEKAIAFDRANVDTDQIIPKQFLKRIEKTGFGQYLFYEWRYMADGSLNPTFELNQDKNQHASILIANENFGCGSSREHAPWALLDYGFKVILAPSFADIFHQNCLKNGVLPIALPKEQIVQLLEKGKQQPYQLEVNLEKQTIGDETGFQVSFEIDAYWKTMLMNGWDEIEITLQLADHITAYEQALR
ncbi:3-isopropylmalate dehydratase small subunit [Cytobacillus kochii]|uniref:3-isopropylmalate dehydratase small subunit n=1 Tax=Cytobacillus kochii TaxID=859143 RepID=UPI002041DB97|nr:3-isopropylmalate dehydratase small subunit [Cytobacillus kochii]MCM3323180.1 3-isopropylmalate dehydratase small subunit [Cytobacillus kochii]MCM3345575.1 3-isopropylmalate dehydratase small subunit [Cytobacillus kochii]